MNVKSCRGSNGLSAFTLVASLLFITGCGDKSQISKPVEDEPKVIEVKSSLGVKVDSGTLKKRVAEIVGSYAELVVLSAGNAVKPQAGNPRMYTSPMKNTTNAINHLNDKVTGVQGVTAMAGVYPLKGATAAEYECNILYKPDEITITTIEHEAGHCFANETSGIKIFEQLTVNKDYDKYLNELSADLITATILYLKDSDSDYLVRRIAEINNKGLGVPEYKLAVVSLIYLDKKISNLGIEGKGSLEAIRDLLMDVSLNQGLYRVMDEATYITKSIGLKAAEAKKIDVLKR